MAVLRMAVREPRVCVWLVRLRAARGQITMSGGSDNVRWSWSSADSPGPFTVGPSRGTGTSAATAVMSYPTWDEVRKVIGPDCRAVDWVHYRYRYRERDLWP